MRLVWAMLGGLAMVVPLQRAAAAPPAAEELVKLQLLADVSSIEPGKPFTVGALLKISPGWHIYWTNPGDSGTPTRVEFQVLDGFKLGPVQFPVPTKFTQPGGIIGYGYTDELLLTATVTPPADAKPGQSVPVAVKADFLVCEKVCIPGKSSATISLPIGSKVEPANRELFEKWAKQVPTDASAAGANVTSSIDPNSHELAVSVTWKRWAPNNPQWFPPADDNVTFSDINMTSGENRTLVTAKVTPLAGKSIPSKTMESVLAYDPGDGVRHGIRIPIELKPQQTDASAQPKQ